jgi:outer membrane protein OmpA-like peptidoglycan-associated protein
MKKVLFFVALAFGGSAMAQDIATQEVGKCYKRCTTPDVFQNQDVTVQTKPAYKVLKVVPATYETVTEKVLVKEASKKLRVIPAVWGTKTISYTKRVTGATLRVTPATFSNASQTIETKPESARWEMTNVPPSECESGNPDDCRYMCYKAVPAEYRTVATKELASDARVESTPGGETTGTYTVRIVTAPARVEEVPVPEEYSSIKKTVLVKEAYTTENVIPAVFTTVSKQVLVTKGGTSLKEVDCKLTTYNALPINWNTGSATLTAGAKSIIDKHLMKALNDNPGSKIEIASHTDSRGSKSSNQGLSDRRAKAVADYLIAKGVNPSRLVANGYGENRLKNRCKDGVSCTEAQHATNRRTEFRIINN